jgi:hypothetical protein
MYPFEVWDENTQRVEFYWNRWSEFRSRLFNQYPVDRAHRRVEIDLYFPSDRLEDVWVHDWNPHHEIGNHHLSVYDCFYDSSNWSTVFDVYPQHDRTQEERGWDNWRLFIEEGHRDPWGEPIRIMSTSANINDNTSIRYAYFRGKYWKIISWIPCHTGSIFEWRTDRVGLFNLYDANTDALIHNQIERMLDAWNWPDQRYRQPPKVDWRKEGF